MGNNKIYKKSDILEKWVSVPSRMVNHIDVEIDDWFSCSNRDVLSPQVNKNRNSSELFKVFMRLWLDLHQHSNHMPLHAIQLLSIGVMIRPPSPAEGWNRRNARPQESELCFLCRCQETSRKISEKGTPHCSCAFPEA